MNRASYPQKHFTVCRLLARLLILACTIGFYFTFHAAFLLLAAIGGVFLVHQLDERKPE